MFGTTVVVSSHLDDAVFSCGALINAMQVTTNVLVVTVCAGVPEPNVMAAPLDVSAGFESAAQAVEARRLEDISALTVLGAKHLHLDVLDYQYERHLRVGDKHDLARYERLRQEQINHALAPVFAAASQVIAPLGIRHPDHKMVATASKPYAAWVYEDLPYRVEWPDQMPGMPPVTLKMPCTEAKLIAVRRYWSQLQGQPGWQLKVSERYHAGIANQRR